MRYIEYGGCPLRRNIDADTKENVYATWSNGISFVLRTFSVDDFNSAGKNKRTKVPITTIAVIARAAQVRNQTKLTKFVDILRGKIEPSRPEDRPAHLLREYLKKIEFTEINKNDELRVEVYGKTEWAVDAFLQERRVHKLIIPDQELFNAPPAYMKDISKTLGGIIKERNGACPSSD